jgi:CheY-like chemotaxis protein
VLGPNDEVEAVVGSTRDITERRAMEEVTRRRAEQLQLLAEIATRINGARDVSSVVGIVTEEARNLIGARQSATSIVLSPHKFRPEFILLDIGLPGMDGYEVAAKMRQEEWCKDAVIVAVSGYGQDEDRRRSTEAGFDHHLIKPLDHDALLSLISPAATRSR